MRPSDFRYPPQSMDFPLRVISNSKIMAPMTMKGTAIMKVSSAQQPKTINAKPTRMVVIPYLKPCSPIQLPSISIRNVAWPISINRYLKPTENTWQQSSEMVSCRVCGPTHKSTERPSLFPFRNRCVEQNHIFCCPSTTHTWIRPLLPFRAI